MKLILIILFGSTQAVYSQDALRNVFSSRYEIHGGMESSGIQRTESYLFVAGKKLTVKGIYFNDEAITLNPGDSMQVSVHSHRDYAGYPPERVNSENKKTTQVAEKKRFRVFQKNRCYYSSVQYPYEWPGYIDYKVGKKNFKAEKKKEFDKGSEDYAP